MLEEVLSTQHFLAWAVEYARSVALAYDPDCIIVFGSTARNQQTPDSDIDVVVIGGNLPADHRLRFRQLMRLRPRFAPLQVQTLTRDEWDRMMARKHVTVLEALKDGIPLHGQEPFARWRRMFEEWLKLGLRRTDCSWVVPSTLQSEPPLLPHPA
jgi:predicted nucleotidyltransferase